MLIRLLRMPLLGLKRVQMSKSALLEKPHLHIPSGGVINGVSLVGKLVRSYL